MNYRDHFNKISLLSPRERGTEFEKLINKIFEDEELLVSSRFRTSDTQQEIDGAIMIYEKIFLVEVKWEQSATLAASKLFSFLGKINSKLEGTLGLFISYNELSSNFIDSVRNGIRQNCILIHGPLNIHDIIDKKQNLLQYLEYCFIQASIKNRVDISTKEFNSLPVLSRGSASRPDDILNNWFWIFESLIGTDSLQQFASVLVAHYLKRIELSSKLINIYNTIDFNDLVRKKFKFFIEKLANKEKARLTENIVEKFSGDNWNVYADEFFLSLLKEIKLDIEEEDRIKIIENVSSGLNGDWESENKVSFLIDVFYSSLTYVEKKLLATKYLEIYCDTFRQSKFQQKKFADKLFKELLESKGSYFDIVKEEIIGKIKIAKLDESLFFDESEEKSVVKAYSVNRIVDRYQRVFNENKIDAKSFVEAEYDKL